MEMCGEEAIVVEVGDMSGKEHFPISGEQDNIIQAEHPSCETQETEVEECLLNSQKHSTDNFVHLKEAGQGMDLPVSHRIAGTEIKAEVEELRANSANDVSPSSPTPCSPSSPLHPPTLSLHFLHPAPQTRPHHTAAQCSEFLDGNRQRSAGINWRNSFYFKQSLEYIACSTVLAVIIPFLGIPAIIYSIRSYMAYKRGSLQQSRHLNLLAFRLILVAGVLLCCLAMVCGALTAYLLVRPTHVVPSEPPTMEVKPASTSSNRNFFHVQGRELLNGRHNVSLLCRSSSRCANSFSSISTDQTVLPLDDPSWNPPEPLATLVKRAELNVLSHPVDKKTIRGSQQLKRLNC